jgi:hypothetical protein
MTCYFFNVFNCDVSILLFPLQSLFMVVLSDYIVLLSEIMRNIPDLFFIFLIISDRL